MELNKYQERAMDFRKDNTTLKRNLVIYPALGLTGEAGEVADKVKKLIRDTDVDLTDIPNQLKKDIALEVGDVLWYVSAIACDLGYTLEEIANLNIEKLSSRRERNKISGSGDHR